MKKINIIDTSIKDIFKSSNAESINIKNLEEIFKTIDEIRNSDYKGPIAIRGLFSGMKLMTHINQEDLEIKTKEYLNSRKCTKKDIIYSEMAAPSMGIKRLMNARIVNLDTEK